AVLDGVLFDAPAPWFAPQDLVAALASSPAATPTRTPPPRPASDAAAVPADRPADDVADLRSLADGLLGGPGAVRVADLLEAGGDWPAARRLPARPTAAHHH